MEQQLKEELFHDFSQFTKIMTIAVNSLKDIFYIIQVHDQTFTYLFANQAGKYFLNDKEGIFGKSFFDLLPKDKAEFLHDQYSKVLNFNKVITFEDDLYVNGKWLTYETVLTPLTNDDQTYIVAVVRDVTERSEKFQELQHVKQLLEKSERRLSSLFENNEDGVFIIDTDGYFLNANPATINIIGYTPLEIIGTSIAQLIAKKELNNLKKYFQEMLKGKSVQFESMVYHKDGREISILFNYIPIITDGLVTGIYGIAKDIIKEKHTRRILHN